MRSVEIAKWFSIIIPYAAVERRIREKFRQMYNSLTRYEEWALIFFFLFQFNNTVFASVSTTFRASFMSHRGIVTPCTCSDGIPRTDGLRKPFFATLIFDSATLARFGLIFLLCNLKFRMFCGHVHYNDYFELNGKFWISGFLFRTHTCSGFCAICYFQWFEYSIRIILNRNAPDLALSRST